MRESPPTLPELAVRAGWPLLAEPTSNLRVPGALSAGPFLLADARFANEHVPEVVVQFGAAPTSRAGLELVRRAGRLVIVDQDHLVADPHRKAAWTLRAEPAGFVPDLLPGSEPAGESAWLRAWTRRRRARARRRRRDGRRVGRTVRGPDRPRRRRVGPRRGDARRRLEHAGARPRRLHAAARRSPRPREPWGERDRRVRLDGARRLGRGCADDRALRRPHAAARRRLPALERGSRPRLRVRRAEQRRRRDLLVPPAARAARVRGAVRDAARARARRDLPGRPGGTRARSNAPPT